MTIRSKSRDFTRYPDFDARLPFVGYRARYRIKAWTDDFARWSQETWKEHDESNDHPAYYIGVIVGIKDARTNKRTNPHNFDNEETGQGYVDARVLINAVLKLGDAPEGDFYDLLASPSAPLRLRS